MRRAPVVKGATHGDGPCNPNATVCKRTEVKCTNVIDSARHVSVGVCRNVSPIPRLCVDELKVVQSDSISVGEVATAPKALRWTTPTVLAGFLAGLSLLAHGNALHNPFVYDDRTEILNNPSIRTLANLPQLLTHTLARPITNFSYALDYQLSGVDPTAYHATNLLLHALASVLLFVLGRTLFAAVEEGLDRPIPGRVNLCAFLAAALLAVHPMMTEAVGYISSRSDLLSTVFFLASVLCFWQAMKSSRTTLLVSGGGFFVLALASKETAVILPVVLYGCERFLMRDDPHERRKRWRRIYLPLFATVVLVALSRLWVYVSLEHADATAISWRNIALEASVIGRYLGLLVFPYHQTIVPPVPPLASIFEPRVWIAVVLIGLLVHRAYLLRTRSGVIPLGILWFFLALMPSAALVVIAGVGQAMAEHRVYLASCGLFLAIGSLVSAYFSAPGATPRIPSRAFVVAAAVLLTVLTGLSIERNRVWSDPVRLWKEAAERSPRTWIAQFGLADAYLAKGDLVRAADAYNRAIAIRPELPGPYLDYVSVLIQLRQYAAARAVLERAMRVPSISAAARVTLASLELNVFRDRDRALALCRQAAEGGDSAALDCLRSVEAGLTLSGDRR